MNNIFVYIELENGAVADVSLELLTKGRELADELVELGPAPGRANFRLLSMESAMASVNKNAVESLSTRWVSGVLSISTLPL